MYSNHAARAYQQTRRAVVTGRELESLLLLKAAAQLQGVKDNWEARKGELFSALTYNRKLWTILIDLILREDNPLPTEDKQNLTNIAVFIFKHTIETQIANDPEMIGPLVSINRTIAEGLRS
ncbi:MAG: flagellar biosynthesis regulator FlaF [Siculibacillus sp.]